MRLYKGIVDASILTDIVNFHFRLYFSYARVYTNLQTGNSELKSGENRRFFLIYNLKLRSI